jgi:hypothetical protein
MCGQLVKPQWIAIINLPIAYIAVWNSTAGIKIFQAFGML